jgi:hypothetical protein
MEEHMNVSIQDVQIGRFFVRESRAREITADLGQVIRYRTYTLETGELYVDLPGECSKEQFARWAERECTTEECARMQQERAVHLEEDFVLEYLRSMLSGVPDKMLIAEAHRRGLKLSD